MFDQQLLAFVPVAIVLSVSPGPDMALVLRNTVRGGRGAGYLVYLGVQSLRSLHRGDAHEVAAKPTGSPFRQGLVTNLLNPKLAVLFTTLLPQFVSRGDPAAKPALLAAEFIAIGLTWLCFYTAAVGAVAHNRTFRRVTEAVSGVVLIALGARLAVER
jgi:threonine/homoserine/homoserine lactone efflux protein